MPTLTKDAVERVLGPVDDSLLAELALTGATEQELFTSLEVAGSGTVDRKDGVTRFTEITLRTQLNLPAGGDQERALRILEKGKSACLVTASLSVPINLQAEILIEL
jgi:organic hydroperoxide reductase OsmC/OhrA